mmetsp:Transcript_98210/g.227739  ORF Transcript_98210/g.227739 Transcript_98210/m.227739 type:complete len:138 (+) Transcript_98210:82-495(+)
MWANANAGSWPLQSVPLALPTSLPKESEAVGVGAVGEVVGVGVGASAGEGVSLGDGVRDGVGVGMLGEGAGVGTGAVGEAAGTNAGVGTGVGVGTGEGSVQGVISDEHVATAKAPQVLKSMAKIASMGLLQLVSRPE